LSIKEYEAHNITWPLANSPNMRDQFSVQAFTVPTFLDMKAVFPKFDAGHAVSVQADNGKVYIALGSVPTAAISLTVGTGVNQCWPLPDGVSERYFKPGKGREIATGLATTTDYRYLQYMGTGTLRLYLSSVAPVGHTEDFVSWPRP
jgi:hypothetical protein